MIIKDRAQALFNALMECDNEEGKFYILHEMAFTIYCKDCPIFGSCKEDFKNCPENIDNYLELKD